jgi:putative endonuclease
MANRPALGKGRKSPLPSRVKGEGGVEDELNTAEHQRQWMVYLLRCADNSLYCGITNNLETRLAAHRLGKGAKYTRSRTPIELVGSSRRMDKSEALKLEHRIKQMPAGRKIAELLKWS